MLVYQDISTLEVDAIPCEAHNLSLAHTGEQSHEVQILEAVALYGMEEVANVILIKRLHFFALHAGQGAGVGGISSEQAIKNSLL